MEKETIIILLVFGGILFLNIISLVLAYTTPYGKSWLFSTMKSEGKGHFIFWNFWMLLTGFTFLLTSLFEIIRFGLGDYSEWKGVSIKELWKKLNEEWEKK